MNNARNWGDICESIARDHLGDPNQTWSNATKLRWGRRGSFMVDRQNGAWYDFEAGEGGGVIDLIVRVKRISRDHAARWLRENYPLPSQPRAPQAPRTRETQPTSRYVEDIWTRSCAIPAVLDHPARLWLADRHLWRPDIDAPEAIRWLPPSLETAKPGAVVALIARPEAWVRAWPDTPEPAGVQLLSVDSYGRPVRDRPADAGGLKKRSRGSVRDGIFMVGAPHQSCGPVRVAEGVADALALAARFDGPAVAMMTSGAMRAGSVANWLATLPEVVIHADNDGRAGPEAAQRLRHAINSSGGQARAVFARHGKDPADAAALVGFEILDCRAMDSLNEAAESLRHRYGWPWWSCQRVAAIRLKGG